MNAKVSKFLWLDMEMTGLDPEKEVIIEAAAIVSDDQLNELDTYHQIVRQHNDYLEKMDKWNTKQHKKSGLYELVPNGIPQEQMEKDLIELINKHFKEEKVILAGNSIYQDRLFIKKHLPTLEAKLHYRMLDISAWKIIFFNKNIMFKKENKHRALDDIRESIKEMKTYLCYLDMEKIKKKPYKINYRILFLFDRISVYLWEYYNSMKKRLLFIFNINFISFFSLTKKESYFNLLKTENS